MLADEIADVLADSAGLTVSEIARELAIRRHAGSSPWSSQRVLLALHSDARFAVDLADSSRWLMKTGMPEPFERNRSAPLQWSGDWPPLYPWQEEALQSWRAAGHRGVVEAVTGAGKSLIGHVAMREELERRGQVLVVVPSAELMRQWAARIRELLPVGYSVGCRGVGETGTLADHDVLVAVVNSARAFDVRPIRPGGLVVADECHRYASPVNRQVLDSRFVRRLGLSATYARDDGQHLVWLEPYFGTTCFELDYGRAIAEKATAPFAVASIAVRLTNEERSSYEELSDAVRVRRAALVALGLPDATYLVFLQAVLALASKAAEERRGTTEARAYLSLLRERRRLLGDASAKLPALRGLASAFASAERSIVFTRSIEAAEVAARVLTEAGLASSCIHSGMKANDRRTVMQAFSRGALRVLAAPHVLDEGIDVPEADLGVIMAVSRSRRQMIQRMGRVLRVKRDGRRAHFALLFAEDTIEDPAMAGKEAFLEELLPVAAEVGRFSASAPSGLVDAAGFLGSA